MEVCQSFTSVSVCGSVCMSAGMIVSVHGQYARERKVGVGGQTTLVPVIKLCVCVCSTHHFRLERRLNLSVRQSFPVNAAEERMLTNVPLSFWSTAQTLRRVLRHQLKYRTEPSSSSTFHINIITQYLYQHYTYHHIAFVIIQVFFTVPFCYA